MTDIFYGIYYRKLMELNANSNIERVNRVQGMLSNIVNVGGTNNPAKNLWRPLPRVGVDGNARVVAVDGGVRELELRNGGALIVARAIAVNNVGVEPIADVTIKLVPVYTPMVKWVLMSLIEDEVALKAIESGKYDALLMDGSLYAKVTFLIHELILTKGFLDLYYIPEVIKALDNLYQLLIRARELGVKIIFVSKDSRLKIYKDYVLFNALKEFILDDAPFINVDKGLIDILNRGIDWYSVVWIRSYRNKLISLAKEYNGVHRDLIRMGIRMSLSQSISDISFLEELARMQGLGKGITRRLLIGAMDAYLNYKSLTQVENLLKQVRDRIEDSAGLRDVDDYGSIGIDEQLNMVRNALHNFPRILMTYIKLNNNDTPIAVEIPYYDWTMFDNAIPWKLLYDKIDVSDQLNILVSMYRDSIHYNYLLWLAHEYADFKSSDFLGYAVTAIDKLKIPAKRRFGLAFNMDLNPSFDTDSESL
ncbi:MAG: DNA double-strand break repair nuclease NurA [Vulcanisaeta sp. AZ3]